MSKIVLIDGHSILNRAFYGVPDFTNSEGLHTGAVYGFLNIMFMIIEEEKPDYLTVAFDLHAPTFRHKIFSEYKGTRSPMPSELREQVPVIKEVLEAMNIQVCSLEGYEADDVLGTIAKKCQKDGLEVSLVSGDRDLLQISDTHIKIRIPKTKAGKTQIEDYYPEDVVSEYGVTPTVFIDMKALMGDSSDNVKGVRGVGPKSAQKLLTAYGSLDGIYEHLDEMKQSAQKDNLIEDKEVVYLAQKLVTILTDAPVDFKLENALINDMYNPDAYTYFKKLEFKNFLGRFDSSNSNTSDADKYFNTVTDFAEVDTYFNSLLKKAKEHTESDPLVVSWFIPKDSNKTSFAEIPFITISDDAQNIVTIKTEGFITSSYIQSKLNELANYSSVRFVLNDSKNLYSYINIPLIEDRCFDVYIAAYLLDPLRSNYDSEYVLSYSCGEIIPGREQLLGKAKTYSELYDNGLDKLISYSSYCVYSNLKSYPVLLNNLKETGMDKLFFEIEMPLTRVLCSMEINGIKVKPDSLHKFSDELGKAMSLLENKIYEAAGEKFNILSPKQLGVILFEKMGLPGGKKTKTGYSTSADVLEKIKDVPMVSDILEYRAYSKLKSTYADGLVTYISDEDRIHSTFNQTITATGRISSADPNLQNIPTRTELGRGLRAVFIPKDGYVFADADYSQIELRILAHIAGDEGLIEAYKEGRDIHRITASKVFGTPLDEVTDRQRRNAKAVNFGIVYGISSFGLSQDLDISRKEAAEYIEQYFETFPGIKAYLDKSVKDAKEVGYVTTLYGRRRPIPELSSSNFMQRSFGERVAMNSPIQGTAADIMKIAMINVYRRLEREGLKSQLVLQVHDELLIETDINEKEIVCKILEEEMINAADLSVRLDVDLHTGEDWLAAK